MGHWALIIEQVAIFKKEARNIVIATLMKIYAKFLLVFDVVKNCTIFNPGKTQPDKATYLKQKAKLFFSKIC